MKTTRILIATFLIAIFSVLVNERRALAAPVIQVVNETSLPRVSSDGSLLTKRSLLLKPEAISRRDCEDDQRVRFTLQLAGFEANGILQAWVSLSGQSCGFATARSGQAPACWRALTNDIPLVSTINVDVPVQTLMSGVPPFSPSSPISDASICGKVDRVVVAVHFLYFGPGDINTAQVMKSVEIEADTVGPLPRPSPPSEIARTVDPKVLQVVSGDPPRPDEILRVFCKPIDANTLSTCSSEAVFQKGSLAEFVPDADFESQFACNGGLSAFGASQVTASNSEFEKAGSSFAFSLAKVDVLGNISSLSDPKCVTLEAPPPPPAEAEDGGCSVAPQSAHRASSAIAPLLLLIFSTVFFAKRRLNSCSKRRNRGQNQHDFATKQGKAQPTASRMACGPSCRCGGSVAVRPLRDRDERLPIDLALRSLHQSRPDAARHPLRERLVDLAGPHSCERPQHPIER